MSAEGAESKSKLIQIKVEFEDGFELLLNNKRTHQVTIQEDGKKPMNVWPLIGYLKGPGQ
jgi:hypothetical protein